jgi:type VI secretion system secreted protein Hcp
MKSKKLIFSLISIAILIGVFSAESWAIEAYMYVTGDNQGPIEGSSTRFPGAIEVGTYGHSLRIPTDINTGQASGQRLHGPVKVVIPFDVAVPKLYQALATGELLTEVQIRFLAPDQEGVLTHFFTVRIQDAHVTDLSSSLIPSDGENHMLMVASFTYSSITWTHVETDTNYTDSWAPTQ